MEYIDQTSDKPGLTSDNSGKTSDKPPETSDKPIPASENSLKASDKSIPTSDKILTFIRNRGSVSTAEVAMELSLSPSRCRAILASMVNQGILIAVGNNKNRRYKIHP